MGKIIELTAEGSITIPADVREALGLKPGEPVELEWSGGDAATIRKARPAMGAERRETHEEKVERIRGEMEEMVKRFSHLATGQSTDEYMAEIREPLP